MRSIVANMRRVGTFAMGAAVLSILPWAQGSEVLHVNWDNLSVVTGRTVRIALPGGVIEGKAAGVESEALVVGVTKTSDRNAYAKGMLRVPREKLHRLEMQTKGKAGRTALTSAGALLGVGGGSAALAHYDHCLPFFGPCGQKNSLGAGVAAFVGITAAGVAGGYFAGNALDKRWTAIEIVP